MFNMIRGHKQNISIDIQPGICVKKNSINRFNLTEQKTI